VPVYINNINNDVEEFKDIGNLIFIQYFINNILNNKFKINLEKIELANLQAL